jgi:hypothetical protein
MTQAIDLADCSAIELLQLYRSRQALPVEATPAACSTACPPHSIASLAWPEWPTGSRRAQ